MSELILIIFFIFLFIVIIYNIYELIILFLLIFIIILSISLFAYFHQKLLNDDMDKIEINNTDCLYKRWGCCNDKVTPKYDEKGSNCRGF